MVNRKIWACAAFLAAMATGAAYAGSSDPDLIFRKSTTFKLLTPNDKLAGGGIGRAVRMSQYA